MELDGLQAVIDYDTAPPNAARFKAAFLAAWTHIPSPNQTDIVDLWERATEPSIELLDNPDLPIADAIANCSNDGLAMTFDATKAKRMPQWVLLEVIVHELAHVLQHAHGRTFSNDAEYEAHAEALERTWGIDPDAAKHWCREHFGGTEGLTP